jgi:hypothetical protein
LSHEPFVFLPDTGGEFLFHFLNATASSSRIVGKNMTQQLHCQEIETETFQ